MGISDALLICAVQVVGLIDVGVGRFGENIIESGVVVLYKNLAGVLGIGAVHGTVQIAGVLQSIGIVSLDYQPLGRGDGEVEGLAQVIYLIFVEMVAVEEHQQAVHSLVAVVLGGVDVGAVRVHFRIAGQHVHGTFCEGVVDTTLARIEVGAVEVAEIRSDTEPVVDVEAEFDAEVHTVVVVGILLEHTLLVEVAAGNQIVNCTGRAAHGYHMVGSGLVVVVENVVPVGVGIVVIHVPAILLGDHNPRACGILNLVVAAGPEFLHVCIGVVCILGAGAVTLPEQVGEVHVVVAAGFIVRAGSGGGDAETAAVGDLGTSVLLLGATLGGDQDDTG